MPASGAPVDASVRRGRRRARRARARAPRRRPCGASRAHRQEAAGLGVDAVPLVRLKGGKAEAASGVRAALRERGSGLLQRPLLGEQGYAPPGERPRLGILERPVERRRVEALREGRLERCRRAQDGGFDRHAPVVRGAGGRAALRSPPRAPRKGPRRGARAARWTSPRRPAPGRRLRGRPDARRRRPRSRGTEEEQALRARAHGDLRGQRAAGLSHKGCAGARVGDAAFFVEDVRLARADALLDLLDREIQALEADLLGQRARGGLGLSACGVSLRVPSWGDGS